MKKLNITTADKKAISKIIKAHNNIETTTNEQVKIQITAFKPIQAKFKIAYKNKDKQALADFGLVTLKSKRNKKGNVTTVIDSYLLPQKRISDLYVFASASEAEQNKALEQTQGSIQNTANLIKKNLADKKVKAEMNKRKKDKTYKIQQEQKEALKKYQNLLEADLSFLNGIELIKVNQLISVILKSSNLNFSDIIKHRQSKIDNANSNKKLKNELPKDGMSANMNAHNFKALQEQMSGKEDLEKYASNSKK